LRIYSTLMGNGWDLVEPIWSSMGFMNLGSVRGFV